MTNARLCCCLTNAQVLQSINARARRAVELGDGGCVVGFMLEPDACAGALFGAEQSADADTSEAHSSPALSYYSASTDLGTRSSLSSGSKLTSRGLASSKDLASLSAARSKSSGVDWREVIEVYDARSDCLQRPSQLGVPYRPAGLWQQRMRLLRRRGFTVLQVGSEMWDAFLAAQGSLSSEGRQHTHAQDRTNTARTNTARTCRAEWLMKLINTATWARTLMAPQSSGLVLPLLACDSNAAQRAPYSEMSSDGGGMHAGPRAKELQERASDNQPGEQTEQAEQPEPDLFALGESASSFLAAGFGGHSALHGAAHTGSAGCGAEQATSAVWHGTQASGKAWKLSWSKNKNKWFYINSHKKQKVWEPPQVEGWLIKPRSHSAANAPDQVYVGLVYYYYNPNTKESSLEPPPAGV